MVNFQGDLLLGGVALRNLDGKLSSSSNDGATVWTGQFEIGTQEKSFLEVGRPYLLLLNDGRSGRIVVTNWEESTSQDALNVHFQSHD